MALCEKYGKDIPLDKATCPDPLIYCNFRGSCLIYTLYEEGLLKKKEEEVEENA